MGQRAVVYLIFPTSNRNSSTFEFLLFKVVYLIFPTSNRNCVIQIERRRGVVYLIFPTSNRNIQSVSTLLKLLYILSFLHQTATRCFSSFHPFCCISYLSYIKPQLGNSTAVLLYVVYLIFPTSNRNFIMSKKISLKLYILSFLHQTATLIHNCILQGSCISYLSYIKPQLARDFFLSISGCISYLSYIKPQPIAASNNQANVVYLIFPTSNRNLKSRYSQSRIVVYLIFPTSNRNSSLLVLNMVKLYILSFLHQTATQLLKLAQSSCCISYLSYIKPQLSISSHFHISVVYL